MAVCGVWVVIPQLGDGSTTDRSTPVEIESSGVLSVSCGFNHSLYESRKRRQSVGMGRNDFGQLGDGSTTDRSTPVEIESSGVLSVSCGGYHSLYIKSRQSLGYG